jgi:hypothetical protein
MKLCIAFIATIVVSYFFIYGFVKYIRNKAMGREFFLHVQIATAMALAVIGCVGTEIVFQLNLLPLRIVGYGGILAFFVLQAVIAGLMQTGFVAFCFYMTRDRNAKRKKSYRQYLEKTADFMISSGTW